MGPIGRTAGIKPLLKKAVNEKDVTTSVFSKPLYLREVSQRSYSIRLN